MQWDGSIAITVLPIVSDSKSLASSEKWVILPLDKSFCIVVPTCAMSMLHCSIHMHTDASMQHKPKGNLQDWTSGNVSFTATGRQPYSILQQEMLSSCSWQHEASMLNDSCCMCDHSHTFQDVIHDCIHICNVENEEPGGSWLSRRGMD